MSEPSTNSDPATKTLGIDFGGTSVKFGVCQNGEIIGRADPIPTARFAGPEALIAEIVTKVEELREQFPEISALGAGVPGLVDFDAGYIHEVTNVKGWVHVPLRSILEDRTGLKTVVDNDANAMTYAEWKFGAARGMETVVALTLGTGIGGGLIIDGKLHRGSSFTAGEIGQMSVNYSGRHGNYGNAGAIEKYVGNRDIASHAVECYEKAGIKRTAEECEPRAIAEAAEAGDPVARQVWADVAAWLGTALANVAWLLNPSAIVIGGGVAKAGELLFKPLESRLKDMLSSVVWQNLEVIPAHFGNDAGIIGSATLAADMIRSTD